MPHTDTPILDFERGPPSGDLEVTSSPFWLAKAMSRDEWESLCDGCGQCCLLKVEEEDTGKIFQTELCCRLLDLRTCRCRDYGNRHASVPDCIVISSPNNTVQLSWLPDTSAYKRIANGARIGVVAPSGVGRPIPSIRLRYWCAAGRAAKRACGQAMGSDHRKSMSANVSNDRRSLLSRGFERQLADENLSSC